MIVRIFITEQGGQREAGRLRLDGGILFAEPATPEDRATLETILKSPLIVMEGASEVVIHADREPKRFLENLYKQYTGGYLRASKPQEGA